MEEEQVDVVARHLEPETGLHEGLDHALHRVTEDLLAVHVRPHHLRLADPATLLVERQEGLLRDVPDLLAERVGEAAVGAEVEPSQPAILVGAADHHRARAIAEQGADVADRAS